MDRKNTIGHKISLDIRSYSDSNIYSRHQEKQKHNGSNF